MKHASTGQRHHRAVHCSLIAAASLGTFLAPVSTLGRAVSGGDHTRRDPSVLTPGSSGRPEFDGITFPTRSAFFFTADEPDKTTPDRLTSITLLALKLKPGTKPELLLAAVEKLRTATADEKPQAARGLAALLGPEAVKAFTDEKTKKFDLPKLLQELTLLEEEEEIKRAKDSGELSRGNELLKKELEKLALAEVPPAPPEKRDTGGGSGKVPPPGPESKDPSEQPPGPEPKDPSEQPPFNGDGIGEGLAIGNGGLGDGIGQGIGQGIGNDVNNPFDPGNDDLLRELDRLKNDLENAKRDANDAREEARNAAQRENQKNKDDKDPGLGNQGSQEQPQPLPLPLPLAQLGSGGGPNLARQQLEVPPVEIPGPIAPPAFQMLPGLAEAQLSGDAINRLSGRGLPTAATPGSAFDKLMTEQAQLQQTNLQLLQTIFSKFQPQPQTQLTTPSTSAAGARTIGDLVRTPNLFGNQPSGSSPSLQRYPVAGSSGTLRPPAKANTSTSVSRRKARTAQGTPRRTAD